MSFQIRRFKARSAKILTEEEEEEGSERSSLCSSPKNSLSCQKTPLQKDHLCSNLKSTEESTKKKENKGLRLSFGFETEENQETFIPKKSFSSQQFQKKNIKISSPVQLNTPLLVEKTTSIPKYNSEYLSELRSSTPSTPKEFCNIYKESININDLSIVENEKQFSDKVPEILDEGIVKALKQRRMEKIRQSKLSNYYIPLEDDNQVVLHSKTNESRLQREDDLLGDGIEGFEEYVDDKIILNKNFEKVQAIRKRNEMRDAIEETENIHIEEDLSSEEELRNWEQTQIRKGVYGPKSVNTDLTPQKKIQPIAMEIKSFEDSIKRLKTKLSSMKSEKDTMLSEIQILMSEKEEILKKEIDVKNSLEKASQDYSNLQIKIPQVNSPIRGLDSIASYSFKNSPLSQTIS
ncbi:hypothetical protein PORY_000125 [Pneumocystis oryctolagi]|uniref:Uncharacterized protein n=1 Tax=Pneumocystis oryctolagi TaxID=42067 RepID=A0ACB7CEC7_9ASCO|nr:hypothetical protein PORY_000125 [Pneumocystis oryctolagi]